MFGFFKYIKRLFTDEIEVSIEDLMETYITNKITIARAHGWIGPSIKEIDFLNRNGLMACDLKSLESLGVTYKPDRLEILGAADLRIQWDHQFDTITTFKKNGGDCNSLNRIAQVYSCMMGHKSYLVTYTSIDPNKNHTTCIYQNMETGLYYDYDYGVEGTAHDDLKSCVSTIAEKYKTEVLAYVVQDMNWLFRKL